MSTPSRRRLPSRWRVSGTTVTPRAVASAGGRSAVESVTMATPRAVTPSRRDDLYFDRLLNLLVPVEQHVLDGSEKEQHREDQRSGEYRRRVKAETDGHPDCRHDPDRCRRREAVDLVALAQDGAGAKEADAGNDLRRDSCRVCRTFESLEPETGEQAR